MAEKQTEAFVCIRSKVQMTPTGADLSGAAKS